MADSYIYIIEDPSGRCYVGQSTDADKNEAGDANTPYRRIFQHVAAVYYKSGDKTDASIPMIQDWPLTWLNIAIFDEKDPAGPYGIDEKTYIKFRTYFTPTGDSKIKSKETKKNKETGKNEETGNLTKLKQARDGRITIEISEDKQKTYTDFTRGEYVDMAEMIWMSRCQLMGKKVLNKVIGGQQSGWSFNGLSGQENININTTPPATLTSMLLSTDTTTSEKNALSKMQAELDKLFDKFLDENMADLIKQQIIRDTNSRKNLFKSKKYKVNDMPIKPILNDAIFKVLNNTGGGANGQTSQFKKELDDIIDKYSKQGLQRFSFAPVFKANNTTSIIENVAKKIANSLLEMFQSTKMGPNWEWNLSFNLVDGKIKYKGRGGQLIGDSGAQTISVSLDQALTFNIGAIQGSWWFKPVHLYDNHVDDGVRWKWTKMVFNYFFQRQKVQQPQLGIIQKAQNNDIHDFITLNSGDVAVVNMESEEDTLSGRLRIVYGQRLSYKNAIFKNWSLLFGRLYALKDKRKWSIIEDDEGKEYAVLLDDKVSIDEKEGEFVVGFELEGDDPFTTDRSDDYSGLIF